MQQWDCIFLIHPVIKSYLALCQRKSTNTAIQLSCSLDMSIFLQNAVVQVLGKIIPKLKENNNIKESRGKVLNGTLITEQNNVNTLRNKIFWTQFTKVLKWLLGCRNHHGFLGRILKKDHRSTACSLHKK